ncbi:MAG: acyl-CoA thioester hydrolase/BAAT C-terminal domain-containing protein [Myxococcaceae bacterium]|nr:acyl-CoA thioester hydrolase/BAAT C-terminal domain-containing protein [Myxococcaceae bacterium]
MTRGALAGWVVALTLSCGPASRFAGQGTGDFQYDVADPRCIPTKRDFTPTIRLVADGGVPDGGLLAWERAEVVVEGLPPCRPLDVIFGQAFGGIAYAVFQADFDGRVSSTQAPLRGSWTGADPDAPITTAEGNLFVQDVRVLADWGAGDYLELTWPRRTSSSGIDVLPVRGARGVFGDLYLPSTPPPWPVLIALGGPEGGLTVASEVARTYVEQGYLVLALSYWKTEGLPQAFTRIPLEYFLEAIELVKEYPGARADRIALVGLSRGAEAALLVGSVSPQVKAVVAVVPSGLSWPAFDVWTEPSWTYRDAGVPYVPWANAMPQRRARPDGGEDVVLREVWGEALRRATPAELEAATIPVERIGGPVLLLAGQDDQVWPSCDFAESTFSRLVDAGHAARHPLDARVCYPGAGHVLNPGYVGLPMGRSAAFEREDGGVFDVFGGSPQVNGQATREAWSRTNAFLEAALR